MKKASRQMGEASAQIKRVAEAIALMDGLVKDGYKSLDNPQPWQRYALHAIAAIGAMQEPPAPPTPRAGEMK